MAWHKLLSIAKIVPAVAPTAGSVAAITAVVVDASGGWDRACFIIQTGAAGTAATLAAKIQSSATSGGSYGDVAGAAITGLVEADAPALCVIDIPVNTAKPFMKVVGAVGTETYANSAVCILYKGTRTNPPVSGLTEYVTL